MWGHVGTLCAPVAGVCVCGSLMMDPAACTAGSAHNGELRTARGALVVRRRQVLCVSAAASWSRPMTRSAEWMPSSHPARRRYAGGSGRSIHDSRAVGGWRPPRPATGRESRGIGSPPSRRRQGLGRYLSARAAFRPVLRLNRVRQPQKWAKRELTACVQHRAGRTHTPAPGHQHRSAPHATGSSATARHSRTRRARHPR